MKIDMSPGNQTKFLDALKTLNNRIHDLVFEKESVWEEYAPLIGDPHINKVLEHNSFFKGVRNSFEKMNDLGNEKGTWQLDKVTGKDDSVRALEMINKLFAGEFNLVDKLTVKEYIEMEAIVEALEEGSMLYGEANDLFKTKWNMGIHEFYDIPPVGS